MPRLHQTASSFICLLALIAFLVLPARAADEPAVVKALYDTFAEVAGERPSHESLEMASDGTITITGLNVVMSAHQEDGIDVRQEMRTASTVLRDIKELSPGLYEIGAASFSDSVLTMGTPVETFVTVDFPTFDAVGWVVRGPELIKTGLDRLMAGQFIARDMKMPVMTVKAQGFAVDIKDAHYKWQGDPATGLGTWAFTIASVKVPEELLGMATGPFSPKALGYDTVDMSMTGVSSMGLTDELVDADADVTIALTEMGALTIAFKVGKIPPSLFDALQAAQKSPENVDVNALMGQTQSITIGGFKLRYDDASLVDRLLDQLAKTEGKTREALIGEAVQTGEFALLGFNSPEFTAQAKAAVQAFLENPGWLQIEAAPDAPVSITQFLQMMGSPAEALKLLKVNVTSGPPAAE